MSDDKDSPTKLPFQINFGLLIAYFLPGAVSVYALGYLSPAIANLIEALETGERIAGPVMLLSVFCLVAGLIVDAFSGVVLETILGRFVKKSSLNIVGLADPNTLSVFKEVVENYYRYFQFKGNTLVAFILFVGSRLLFSPATLCGNSRDIALNLASIVAIVILFLGAKQSLASMYQGIDSLNTGGNRDVSKEKNGC